MCGAAGLGDGLDAVAAVGDSLHKRDSDVAARAATTPQVICWYYDWPDLDPKLRRRITQFDGIDICEHSDPTDVDEVVNDAE